MVLAAAVRTQLRSVGLVAARSGARRRDPSQARQTPLLDLGRAPSPEPQVLYLRVSRDRSVASAVAFFRKLADVYSRWPQEAITDGDPYQVTLFVLGHTRRVWITHGMRNDLER